MRECKTCRCDYTQRGGDPTLLEDECMPCELERLREELAASRAREQALREEVAAYMEKCRGLHERERDAVTDREMMALERDEARVEIKRLRSVLMRVQPYVPEYVLDDLTREDGGK